jgi:hypothetical protein
VIVGNAFDAFSVRRRHGVSAALVLFLSLCVSSGCEKSASSPVSPSDAQLATRWSVDGVVRASDSEQPLPGATIRVADGVNNGRVATADEHGRYRLDDLEAGEFLVNAVADGFDLQSRAVALAANQTVDFVLPRSSVPSPGEPAPTRWTLSGKVVEDGGGNGVPGARVRVVSGPDRGASDDTDAAGRYSLAAAAGTFTVEASADGFEAARRDVTLASDAVQDFRLERTSQPGLVVTGVTVDGVSNDGVSGATVRVDGGVEATSGSDGRFELELVEADPVLAVSISSSSMVERSTRMRVSEDPATFTLIPTAINLPAFDQMFRGNGGALRRWTSAPTLVVERRVLQFTGLDDGSFVATAATMSEDDVRSILDDLEWALPQLTGGRFHDFADRAVETANEGDVVAVQRQGTIVVAEFSGLMDATSFWGYTRWAWNERGEVRAAVMMLDRGFETSGSSYRRSLRAHELGHALGYNHVDVRESVMNVSARVAPTPFDRDGSRLAFLRPPMNESPDVDPDPLTVNRAPASVLTWSGDR